VDDDAAATSQESNSVFHAQQYRLTTDAADRKQMAGKIRPQVR
jgi:hypothetical protein